jgi:hypothetical protein
MDMILDPIESKDRRSQTYRLAPEEIVDNRFHFRSDQTLAVPSRPDRVVEEPPIRHGWIKVIKAPPPATAT